MIRSALARENAIIARCVTRLILPLGIAMTLPAHAEPAYRFGTSTVVLGPADAPAVARIDYHNGFSIAANTEVAALNLGGLQVVFTVTMGPGERPDSYAVTVPEGFIAVPPDGVVEEEAGAVVMIYDLAGVGM